MLMVVVCFQLAGNCVILLLDTLSISYSSVLIIAWSLPVVCWSLPLCPAISMQQLLQGSTDPMASRFALPGLGKVGHCYGDPKHW